MDRLLVAVERSVVQVVAVAVDAWVVVVVEEALDDPSSPNYVNVAVGAAARHDSAEVMKTA